MARYVDGFVVPVPRRRLATYRRLARIARAVWLEHGALDYAEYVADDLPPDARAGFARGVRLRADETVVFAYIVYRSRRHRDAVNKKVMADPRVAGMEPGSMPYDSRRLCHGGFRGLD